MAQISSISIDTSSAKKSIADLEKELQETNEQLKQVDINSQAFNDLQKKAANAKGQIDQINKTTDALSKGFQGFGENLAKVTGGISGGITAATAAMQLMGVENENVMQGIAKLQQLMAFTQGISSLKDLGEGFKNLKGSLKAVTGSLKGVKGALIGTGIGAFVVLLGEMVAHWDEITASIDSFIGTAGDASKVTAGLDSAITAIKTSLIAVGNTIVQFVITPFKGVFNAIQAFTDTNGSVADKLKAAAKSMVDTTKEAANSVVNGFKEVGTATAKAYNDSIDQQNAEAEAKRKAEAEAKAKEEREAAKKRAGEQAKAEAEARKRAEEALDIELERLQRSSAEDRLQLEIAIEKRRLTLMKENTLEYEKQLTKIYNLEQQFAKNTTEVVENTVEDLGKLKDEAAKFLESILGTEEVSDKNKLQEYFKKGVISTEQFQEALAKLNESEEMAQLNATLDSINAGMVGLTDSIASIIDGSLDTGMQAIVSAFSGVESVVASATNAVAIFGNESASAADKASAIAQVASVGFSAVGDVLNQLAKDTDTATTEGFEKQKQLQIAGATMNYLSGLVSVWVSAMNPANSYLTLPGQIALGAAQTIALTATYGAQVAKLKQMQLGSTTGATSSVSSNVGSSTITPPTQYTQAVQGANIEQKLADSRVYLVESDVTNTQNRVKVQESENTY